MMTYKPIEKVEYLNSYEKRRDLIQKEYHSWDEDGVYINCKGQHISFFTPSTNGSPVNGKEAKVFETNFTNSVNIKQAFSLVKDKMMTKGGKTLRKKMLTLKPYEVYDYAALLNYLRESWEEGNRGDVLLSYKEYKLLFTK